MQSRSTNNNAVRWASGLNVLAGIWVIISPFVLGFSTTVGQAMTNNVIVGIIVAVLAAIMFFGAYRQAWLGWIDAILGIWLIISPFVLAFSNSQTPLYNNIIFGIIVLVLGAWSALASRGTSPA